MHKLPRANAINSLPISLNFHKNTFKTTAPPTLNSRKTTKNPPKEKLTNLSKSAHLPSPQHKAPISLRAKPSQRQQINTTTQNAKAPTAILRFKYHY